MPSPDSSGNPFFKPTRFTKPSRFEKRLGADSRFPAPEEKKIKTRK